MKKTRCLFHQQNVVDSKELKFSRFRQSNTHHLGTVQCMHICVMIDAGRRAINVRWMGNICTFNKNMDLLTYILIFSQLIIDVIQMVAKLCYARTDFEMPEGKKTSFFVYMYHSFLIFIISHMHNLKRDLFSLQNLRSFSICYVWWS